MMVMMKLNNKFCARSSLETKSIAFDLWLQVDEPAAKAVAGKQPAKPV